MLSRVVARGAVATQRRAGAIARRPYTCLVASGQRQLCTSSTQALGRDIIDNAGGETREAAQPWPTVATPITGGVADDFVRREGAPRRNHRDGGASTTPQAFQKKEERHRRPHVDEYGFDGDGRIVTADVESGGGDKEGVAAYMRGRTAPTARAQQSSDHAHTEGQGYEEIPFEGRGGDRSRSLTGRGRGRGGGGDRRGRGGGGRRGGREGRGGKRRRGRGRGGGGRGGGARRRGHREHAGNREGGAAAAMGSSQRRESREWLERMGELKRTRSWGKAVDMYKQASKEPDFSRVMFNTAIATLSRSPLWKESLSIFQEMRDAGHEPDAYTFNSAIQACAHGRQEKLAFTLFKEMSACDVTPDVYTYTHLVTLCGQTGEWEAALSLLEDMEAAGLRPNSVTYNGIIVAYGNADQPERAVGLLDEMRGKGVQVTEGSYSAAIAACGKAGEWERALLLLEEMKDGGDNLEPNEYCYNSAICACERASRWSEAMELLRGMQSAELVVTAGSYAHVIKACINAGEVSQAEALLEEMRAADVHVKSRVAALVAKHVERRKQQGGWNELARVSVPPTAMPTPPTTTAATASTTAPTPPATTLPTTPTRTTPTPTTASTAMPTPSLPTTTTPATITTELYGTPLPLRDDPPPAWQQQEQQQARGGGGGGGLGEGSTKSPRVAVKAFLRIVGNHAKSRRWGAIVRELEDVTANPNTRVSMRMYEGCIAGLATGGRWVEALQVLEMIQGAGLVPAPSCVTAAIRACAKAQQPRWGLGMSLLRGMEEPDVWAYVATLSCLSKGGQWKTCASLLEEMGEVGLEPNMYCYISTLTAFRRAEPPQWEKASALLVQMKGRGVEPSALCFSIAAQACLDASQPAEAQSLMSEMVETGHAPDEELKTLIASTCAGL